MSAEDWFPSRTLAAAEAASGPAVIDAILAGELGGAVLREVYPADAVARVVARIEADLDAFPRSYFPPDFHAFFLGECLDLADPSLDAYFARVPGLVSATRAAFAGEGDFETRYLALLAALAGDRPVVVPRGPKGESYAPFTFRCLSDGGFIPPHVEAEQSRRPPYRHLGPLIDGDRIVSAYVVLQAPDAGGELGVSSLRFREIGPADMNNGRTAVGDRVATLPKRLFTPAAGEAIVFDGGTHVHWVEPVRGARVRWTVGGFLAPSRDGSVVYAWS